MDEIRRLARKLGDALAADPRAATLKTARDRFEADEEAQRLQKEYDEIATVLRDKIAGGQPLEPDEKRREADLRARVAAHATIRDLLKAQADFAELMNTVNTELDRAIG